MNIVVERGYEKKSGTFVITATEKFTNLGDALKFAKANTHRIPMANITVDFERFEVSLYHYSLDSDRRFENLKHFILTGEHRENDLPPATATFWSALA